MPRNLDRLSRMYSEETWRVYAFLDQSLEPRSLDMLYDVAGEHLRPGSVVLDAGCRDAKHLIRLVEEHDVVGVGVDPVEVHIERAKAAVAAAGLADSIEVFRGVMQELPYPDGHFDFVWCRDVIEGVDVTQVLLGATLAVVLHLLDDHVFRCGEADLEIRHELDLAAHARSGCG